MPPLRDTIARFRAEHRALAHFNISDSNQLEAIARAAKETKLPVLIGLSEGERTFFPIDHARALINLYDMDNSLMYLNADHTYSIEKVEAAITSGVNSVVVDGAQLSFADNVALLKQSVAVARAQNRDVLIEGELGYIGTSSNVMDSIPEGAVVTEEMMTKPEELQALVAQTGIDMIAPAVGNIHGIVRSGQPKLSISRIKLLAESVNIPLVLHGGSGSPDAEFRQAVEAGIAIIHINTDLRVLYKEGIERSEQEHAHEVAPYKILEPVVEEMQKYVAQKMRLFAGQ